MQISRQKGRHTCQGMVLEADSADGLECAPLSLPQGAQCMAANTQCSHQQQKSTELTDKDKQVCDMQVKTEAEKICEVLKYVIIT